MGFDDAMQRALKSGWQRPPQGPCPTEMDLAAFVLGRLGEDQRRRIQDHLVTCTGCLDAVAHATTRPRPRDTDGPSPSTWQALSQKMKIPAQAALPSSGWKRHRYLLLALLAFAGSFTIPRYFLQWLALALIFGGKWVFDTASTRALVMIYESIRKDRLPARQQKIFLK